MLFADLLSLHLVTFLMFFITCLCHFFSSRRMPELRFAITQLQKSVLTRQHIWTIDSGISYTGSNLAEESLTQASVQALSQTLLWMDDKASSPCLKTGVPIDPGIQKA